ncbi:MAG: hypothetical protein D6769_01865 [Methanobacteriota archaeon]|nr:MAG: hypothetical protein D6769_01865 [Euryarchaeota archaeon]
MPVGIEEMKKKGDALAELPLEELMEMADHLTIELEKDTREAERFEAQIRVIKQALKEYKEGSKKEGRRFEETDLYKEIITFLDDIEERLERVKVKNGEYITFLFAIKKKMGEERKKKKELKRFKKE